MIEKFLRVAIIQTTVDVKLAWGNPTSPSMDQLESERVWQEIRDAVTPMTQLPKSRKPHIIVMPELTLTPNREYLIFQLADQIGSIIMVGEDFLVDNMGNVENRALVAIPNCWPFGKGQAVKKHFYVGKHFAAKEELIHFDQHKLKFKPSNQFYVLDTVNYGKIGISICADFYDIERYAIYKGRVQHIFVLAYNKDIKSFYFLAEAISRLVYCNVVICNTGYYGGSIAFSLFDKDYKRYVYKHEGATLFTSQIISLPVAEFIKEQAQGHLKPNKNFKGQPPEYFYKGPELPDEQNIKKENKI